jgi:two-component system, NarL family, response regulator DegU
MKRALLPSVRPQDAPVSGERTSDRTGPQTRSAGAWRISAKLKSRTGKATRDEKRDISILLIDDNRLFRMGLSALLRNQEGLRLLAASGEPETAMQQARGRTPDVILLDLGLGDRGSLHIVRGIRMSHPEARLIMMGIVPVRSEILELVKEGVSGFALKDASISDFVATIRSVAAGQRVLPSTLTESLFTQIVEDAARKGVVNIADVKMTKREREIVDLLADGLSNKEIAERLTIATDTVKSHVHNILEKLSLRSRAEVAGRTRARVPSAVT